MACCFPFCSRQRNNLSSIKTCLHWEKRARPHKGFWVNNAECRWENTKGRNWTANSCSMAFTTRPFPRLCCCHLPFAKNMCRLFAKPSLQSREISNCLTKLELSFSNTVRFLAGFIHDGAHQCRSKVHQVYIIAVPTGKKNTHRNLLASTWQVTVEPLKELAEASSNV